MPFVTLLFDKNSPIMFAKCVPFVLSVSGSCAFCCCFCSISACVPCLVPNHGKLTAVYIWCGVTAILPKPIRIKGCGVFFLVVYYWYPGLGFSVDTAALRRDRCSFLFFGWRVTNPSLLLVVGGKCSAIPRCPGAGGRWEVGCGAYSISGVMRGILHFLSFAFLTFNPFSTARTTLGVRGSF